MKLYHYLRLSDKDDIMRGMYSRGHKPGVNYYHGENGKILVNDENKEKIRIEAEELSKEIFNSNFICPQVEIKTESDHSLIQNSSDIYKSILKLKNYLN
jgi:hypothetical protein